MGCACTRSSAFTRSDDSLKVCTLLSTGAGKLLDEYSLGRLLGQGSFGVVYTCRRRVTNEDFAVKMIDRVETTPQQIHNEVQMLEMLSHQRIVKFHGVFYERIFVCMVMELYPGGDLVHGMKMHWKNKGAIQETDAQRLTRHMSEGIAYLHGKGVVHRDIKADNYLMNLRDISDPKCQVFLSDFGTVRLLRPGQRLGERCGTKHYWAPEIYRMDYAHKVDVWALGVLVFGLLSGCFPFKDEDEVLSKCPYCSGSHEAIQFVRLTLDKDEPMRVTASDALCLPWMQRDTGFDAITRKLSGIKKNRGIEASWSPESTTASTAENINMRGFGADVGVCERRLELVERLQQAHEGEMVGQMSSEKRLSRLPLRPFSVNDWRSTTGKIRSFDWWDRDKVSKVVAGYLDGSSAAEPMMMPQKSEVLGDGQNTAKTLKEHGIDTSGFGQNLACSLQDLADEVLSGRSSLMLDAAQHKHLVRAVDVAQVRLSHTASCGTTRFLTACRQAAQGGEDLMPLSGWQLPGLQKMPYENALEAVERLLYDELGMGDCGIEIDYESRESYEETAESPYIPGFPTVFRCTVLQGFVTTTDEAVLSRIGAVKAGEGAEGANKEHVWLTVQQCFGRGLVVFQPSQGTISSLVHPPVGFQEEELKQYLQANSVRVSRFGKDGSKSLEEFSEELVSGKAQLMRHTDGRIIRVVDVVVMNIWRPDTGQILMAVNKKSPAGEMPAAKLPAVKRRPDENHFMAAHRLLAKILRVDEHSVSMKPDDVLVREEESESNHYFGLPTLYRKIIISAEVRIERSV